MKQIELIWNLSGKDLETKGLAICDLIDNCDQCHVSEQCHNAPSHDAMAEVYKALATWANQEVKPIKTKAPETFQTDLFN